MKRKGSRNIVVDGEPWNYLVGKKFVDIRGPKGKKYLLPKEIVSELIRVYECIWDCCEEDCPDNQRVRPAALPSNIAAYIRRMRDVGN